MNGLNDKVALVTGGAVRIGREISLALAQAGCDVIVHYRDSLVEAETLAEEIRDMGRQAWTVCGDLSNSYEPAAMMRTAWDLAGWVDILVNNAAMFTKTRFDEVCVEDFEELWRVNTLAPVMLAKTLADMAAANDILPADYCGRVVNILDRRVAKPDKHCMPYWLSKKGLEAFTLVGALEMAPRITVNAVAPGPAMIPDNPELLEPAGAMPLAARCIPKDIADAVLYLASAVTVTGQILYVDSGQHLI